MFCAVTKLTKPSSVLLAKRLVKVNFLRKLHVILGNSQSGNSPDRRNHSYRGIVMREKHTSPTKENNNNGGTSLVEVEPYIDTRTGEWVLSEWDIECLIVGAGVQASGGGGSLKISRRLADEAMKAGKTFRIITPERLMANADPSRDMVVPAALMGDPQRLLPKHILGVTRAVECMNDLYSNGCYDENAMKNQTIEIGRNGEKYINNYRPVVLEPSIDSKRIVALSCVEIGAINCITPLVTASDMGLPVVDCDGIGRSVPKLEMIGFFINGLPPYPATLANETDRRLVMLKIGTAQHLDTCFRKHVIDMGGAAGIALPPLLKDDLMSKMTMHSLSHAWRIGRTILRSRQQNLSPIDAVCKQENGNILIIGHISEITYKEAAGFTKGVLQISGLQEYEGSKLVVEFLNESLFARLEGEDNYLACAPDIISIFKLGNENAGEPVLNEDIRPGMNVVCVALPAPNVLRSERALQIVGHPGYKSVGKYVEEGPVGPLL